MFRTGQTIGDYTLIEKLGRGGFGEVWLAEYDEELFALKLPHKDQVDWKSITQEIGLWTLCGKHPNIMPIVGARNFNGQIAIISEYAPDGSLEDLLRKKGKLSEIEAVEMIIGILEGLQHLHESGIIHRDLKPANILLDGNIPRLTDFGISRIISANSSSETIAGTWAYMAPECFDGKRNVQTDIWAVGVILYRMWIGNLPFSQQEQTELIGAIIMKEPTYQFETNFKQLVSIVSKALNKNLVKRYQIVYDFLEDLRKITDEIKFQNSINEIHYKETDEILISISSHNDKEGNVKVNEYGHEVIRRAFEEYDIRKGNRIRGSENPYPAFGGFFLSKDRVEILLSIFDSLIIEAKEKNYPDEEMTNLKILIENIVSAANDKSGTATVYLHEWILPELYLQRRKYLQSLPENKAKDLKYVFEEFSKAKNPEEKKQAIMKAIEDLQNKN